IRALRNRKLEGFADPPPGLPLSKNTRKRYVVSRMHRIRVARLRTLRFPKSKASLIIKATRPPWRSRWCRGFCRYSKHPGPIEFNSFQSAACNGFHRNQIEAPKFNRFQRARKSDSGPGGSEVQILSPRFCFQAFPRVCFSPLDEI